jgi:hypothetical protein
VRTPGAIRDTFWQDEVTSARILGESTPLALARHVARTESTPPLWYAVGWLWRVAGAPVKDVRFLSVLAGAALATLTFAYARTLLARWPAAAAGALAAFGAELVDHGRELRAYELFAALAVAFALLVRAAARDPRRGRLVALGACVAAGTLTHYFFVLAVVAAAAWLAVDPGVRTARRRVAIALGVGLLAFLPWLPVAALQYHRRRFSWIGPFHAARVLDTPWRWLVPHDPTSSALHLTVPALLALAVLAGAVVLWRDAGEGRLCALLLAVPYGVSAVAWAAGVEIFAARNLLGAAPFAFITLAAGAAAVPARAGVAAAGAAAVLACAVVQERTPPRPYDRIAHELVAEGWRPGMPVLLYGDFFSFRSPLESYLPGRPTLTAGTPTARACAAVLVVAGRGPGEARTLRDAALTASRTAGSILVARIEPRAALRRRARWRSAQIVVTRPARGSCVRPLSEARLAAGLPARL